MITISLCMIVKNEEAVLRRCLDSLEGLMEEIIIVDTGSTDQTKEIAFEYTDKVYDFAWINDFSAARNFSFSKASMDFIYSADADEVLEAADKIKFAALKEALSQDIEIVQMLYCNQLAFNTTYNFDREYRPKLFKRLREFVWQEAIHESVRLDPTIYNSEICITHKPMKSHGSRDFAAFQSLIKKGENLSKKLHNMYARELFIVGEDTDFFEAAPFFKESVEDTNRSIDEIKEAVCVLSKTARLRQDLYSLLKYAAKDLVSEPCSELCFELGELYYSSQEYEEAIIWYYNAAYETKSILNIESSSVGPLNRLSDCYMAVGNLQKAEEFKNLAKDCIEMGEKPV